ncbi:MAG: hypothetical protein IJJ28_02575 [Lentisphaeria bacterium]|nr:hypothetical protein [Lentisphaeria bacterium]
MEEHFEIRDNGAVWTFRSRGGSVLELARPEMTEAFFKLGRVKCGKFGELSVLPEKFRLHRAEDSTEAEVESAGVIPFGCEYRVVRNCRVAAGNALLTVDLAAVTGGKVDGVELEPVTFAGELARVEFMIFGENSFRSLEPPFSGTFYSGSEVPLMVRATFADGRKCEVALGADVWRHRAASRMVGAASEYELAVTDGGLQLLRRVLKYDPEVDPERRPWRFNLLVGWSDGATPPEPEGEPIELPGCALSAQLRRDLRALVRRSGGSLVWRNVAPGCCTDAAHVARAGRSELEHFDLEELFADWLWANRQLGRSGGCFTLVPAPGSPFADSVILRNLGRPAAKLS